MDGHHMEKASFGQCLSNRISPGRPDIQVRHFARLVSHFSMNDTNSFGESSSHLLCAA